MSRADAAWLAFWAAFGVGDWVADRRGCSLSVSTRRLFRTHHPVGRGVVTAGLLIGAVVLERHINKPIGGLADWNPHGTDG